MQGENDLERYVTGLCPLPTAAGLLKHGVNEYIFNRHTMANSTRGGDAGWQSSLFCQEGNAHIS